MHASNGLESVEVVETDPPTPSFLGLEYDGAGVFLRSSGRGSRLEREAVLANRSSSIVYPGPAYDGALWLARPRLRADGNIDALVCWDRRGRDWEKITIGPDGVLLTSAFAAGVMAMCVTYGQSLGKGSTPLSDAAAYTTSPVDPGNALMFDQDPFFNPYVGDGRTLRAFIDLKHVLHDQYGETHIGSFALQMLALMNAAGAKIPGIYWSKGNGGQSMRDLGDDVEGYVPKGKIGGLWQDLIRSVHCARREIVNTFRKKPAMLPMIFVHGEEDSYYPGLNAVEYCSGLRRVADLWNADLRRGHEWASAAPDLPIVITQTKRTPPWMYSSGNRIYKRGVDGPRLAQWAAPYLDSRLVLAGPNHHLPAAKDGSHLTPAGYFRLGEQIARQYWACTFGTGPRRFNPFAVIRQSPTEFDILFQMPSGSLALDTVNVTDALDGQKGFVCWDNATNSGVAISNVTIASANSVRVVMSADPRTTELWCDYALWGDSSSLLSQPATGPRGNLRTDTAYASLLGSFGGPETTDHDWCPAFRIPVPFWSGSPTVWMMDGRL
ncbi:MAG: hypothetical protein K2X72_19785 [Reyranella sp.]|nr:hypothetical protein [Reyranella sp.]